MPETTPGASPGSPSAGTTTRAVARARVAGRRPADARGRGHHVSAGIFSWALLEPARARTTSAGWTGSSTCCTTTASGWTSARPPSSRPPGSTGPTRGPSRHRRRGAVRVRLPRRHLPQQRRLPCRRGEHHHPARRALRHSPGPRALARHTSTASPSRPATATPAPRTSALARDRVRHGGRRQRGVGHRVLGQRYAGFDQINPRAPPRRSATRPRRWTTSASPTPPCARTSSPSGTSCTACRPASRSPPTS